MVDNITTNNSPPLPSDQDFPSQGDSECFDHDGRGSDRIGAILRATAFILLALAGPQVWFLPWSMAQLGWIAGPAAIILFSLLTCIASIILCDFYYSPDSTGDKKNHTYLEVIRSNLGGGTAIVKICWVLQFLNLLVGANWCIVLASQMMADMKWVSACNKINNVHGDYDDSNLSCWVYQKPYFIVFGVTQLLLSQIPNFDQLNLLVILCFGAFVIQSSIGVGLSLTKITNKYWIIEGSLVGIKLSNDGHVTRAKKTWMIFEALGNIAGAFDLSSVLLEVEDTIQLPVQEAQEIMRKAIQYGLAAIAYMYLFFGCLGYAAFGDESPEYIFLSNYHEPPWLLNIASAAAVFQYAGGYQIYVQPIFAMFEKAAKASLGPDNVVIKKEIKIWIPILGKFIKLKLFRLVLRTFFVILTTLLPMFLKVYDNILELIEILVFWPIVFYFPVKIYIMRKSKTPMWSCAKGLGIQIMSFGVLIVSIAAAAGYIANVFLKGAYDPIMPDFGIYDKLS